MFLVVVFNNCTALKRVLWLGYSLATVQTEIQMGEKPYLHLRRVPKTTATANLSISGCHFKEGITSIARETCCKDVKLGSLGVSLVP